MFVTGVNIEDNCSTTALLFDDKGNPLPNVSLHASSYIAENRKAHLSALYIGEYYWRPAVNSIAQYITVGALIIIYLFYFMFCTTPYTT